jgi:hypothetical protein
VFKILQCLIQNPFEFATSIMNLDSKWLSTLKFSIPHSKQFLSLSSIGFRLVTYTFFIMNTDSRKLADISHTVHIMNALRRSPISVHDVAGKSAIYQLHHEGA